MQPSTPPPTSALKTLLYFPVTRIVIGLTLCIGIGLLGQQAMYLALNHSSLPATTKDPISGSIFAFLVCAIYITLYKRYEKRKVTELSARRLPFYLTLGILLGTGLASLSILVEYFYHDFVVVAIRPILPLVPTGLNTFVNAITAEVLIIGVLFRIMEDSLGSYFTLIILVIIFFILHIGAPGATAASAIAVSMHAALLLGSSYIYTRNLWLPITIHFAWDFSLAAIYGASVSGYTMTNSLLDTKIKGPTLLTGGYFGPQGSIQAALLCLISGIILLHLSRRQNKIKKAFFHKPS
jgi:membrane protease YdiL (CAAX protease family)